MHLPTPKQLFHDLPLSLGAREQIEQWRVTIRSILSGQDKRQLLVVGPCSIDSASAALEYAKRLHLLSLAVKDRFFIVMRAHLEKPRTLFAWKGFIHDPLFDGSCNVLEGLYEGRKLLLDLQELGIPVGGELLDPLLNFYLYDLFSWGVIGARTVTSQPHRQLAAWMPFPVGFKNTVHGAIEPALHAIQSAVLPQYLIGVNENGHPTRLSAPGNEGTHLILRGGKTPNYDTVSRRAVQDSLKKLPGRFGLVIDCAHGNSNKDLEKQKLVFNEVVQDLSVRGIMLESYLESGQQVRPEIFGCSLTDPCLDWLTTQQLILQTHL